MHRSYPEQVVKATNPNAMHSPIMGQIAFGEPLMVMGRRIEANPTAFEYATMF